MNPNPTDSGYCPVCGEFQDENPGWNAHLRTAHPPTEPLFQPRNRSERRAAAKLARAHG